MYARDRGEGSGGVPFRDPHTEVKPAGGASAADKGKDCARRPGEPPG